MDDTLHLQLSGCGSKSISKLDNFMNTDIRFTVPLFTLA